MYFLLVFLILRYKTMSFRKNSIVPISLTHSHIQVIFNQFALEKLLKSSLVINGFTFHLALRDSQISSKFPNVIYVKLSLIDKPILITCHNLVQSDLLDAIRSLNKPSLSQTLSSTNLQITSNKFRKHSQKNFNSLKLKVKHSHQSIKNIADLLVDKFGYEADD